MSMDEIAWEAVWMDPELLLDHHLNWRGHPEEQMDALDESIAEHGWLQEVLWNKRTGRILDGHARVKRAKEKMERCVVHVLDVDEDEEERILASIDRIGELREHKPDVLAELLRRTSQDGTPPAGWSAGDMDELLALVSKEEQQPLPFSPPNPPEPPPPPVVPEEPEEETPRRQSRRPPAPEPDGPVAIADVPERAHTGDIWLLGGKHRLMVGSPRDSECVMHLMDGHPMHACVTVPPVSNWHNAYSTLDHDEFVESTRRNYIADMEGWWKQITCARRILLPDPEDLFLWIDPTIHNPHPALGAWLKHNAIECSGASMLNQWEPFVLFSVTPNDRESDLFTFPVGTAFTELGESLHPTALIAELIRCYSPPGGNVYDPFARYGTGILAAEGVGRTFYGFEEEPRVADIALYRYEKITGKTVEHLGRFRFLFDEASVSGE